MPSRSLALILGAALLVLTPAAAGAEDHDQPVAETMSAIDAEQFSRCDLALALWDDVAADPDPGINPTRKARRHLKRGVALCRAGDDSGPDYLFNALTLIGATGA